MATTNNYPEMHGNAKGNVQTEFISFLGKSGKYRVKSLNEIEVKRGIEADGVVGAIGANNVPNKNSGWFRYYMTPKAWDKFVENNDVVLNILLD